MQLNTKLKLMALFVMSGLALFLIVLGVFFTPQGSTKAHTTNRSASTPRAAWIVLPPPAFAGKVVHYSIIETIYMQRLSGSIYQIKLLGDVWEKIGPDNHLQTDHAIYTNMADNSFYQEIYEDSSAYLVVFSKNIAPKGSGQSSASSCIQQQPTHSLSQRDEDLVPFVDTSIMKQQGFQMSSQTSRVSQTAPDPLATGKFVLANAKPLGQYPIGNIIHTWTQTKTLANGGGQELSRIEIDQNSRVVFEHASLTDTSGHVLSSTTFAFGRVVLYAPQDVSALAFSNAQQIRAGGCSR